MIKFVEWCYRRAPVSSREIGTFDVIDSVRDRVVKDYLLKRSNYDIAYIDSMTIEDLANIDPDDQYITLLTYIFTKDIKSISSNEIITFIDWMLYDVDLYETGLIAYIWSKSCLYSADTYPSHTAMISAASNGCDRRTLQFLWDVANSNDMYLCVVVSELESKIGLPSYFKMVSYLYICSGISLNDILLFISDVTNMTDDDVYDITDLLLLYTWDCETLYECIHRGYGLRRLEKYLDKYAEASFLQEGRKFPIMKLSKKLTGIRSRFKTVNGSMPKAPKKYDIDYHMWDKRYPMKNNNSMVIKSKYEIWFENLNTLQLNNFKVLNPIAYNACMDGNIKYVEKLLDDIMEKVGV